MRFHRNFFAANLAVVGLNRNDFFPFFGFGHLASPPFDVRTVCSSGLRRKAKVATAPRICRCELFDFVNYAVGNVWLSCRKLLNYKCLLVIIIFISGNVQQDIDQKARLRPGFLIGNSGIALCRYDGVGNAPLARSWIVRQNCVGSSPRQAWSLMLKKIKSFFFPEKREPKGSYTTKERLTLDVDGEKVVVEKRTRHFQLSRDLFLDDDYFIENSDIIKGYVFHANPYLWTPLRALRRHGETYTGKPSGLPDIGPIRGGAWLPKTITMRELGVDIDEFQHDTACSNIGSIKVDEYIPFLISFREIVEGNASVPDKIKAIDGLSLKNSVFAGFVARNKKFDADFPASFFYLPLTEVDGIGKKTARALFDAGIHSLDDLNEADDMKILAVPGIGRAALGKIRVYFS